MSLSVEVTRAAEILLRARTVAAFVGAGLSAESGLATFTGSGGLWEGHPVELVATPEGFRSDPVLVWRFYAARQQEHAQVTPNPGHCALAELERTCDDFLLVSQNVDRLCEAAGSRELVKIHGDLFDVWCTRCPDRWELPSPLIVSPDATVQDLPHCRSCGGLARPGIVWFGEYLPPGVLERSHQFVGRCDALLVVGTSGLVSGGYGLAETAIRGGAAVIEINLEPTALSDAADVCILEPSGTALPAIVELMGDG